MHGLIVTIVAIVLTIIVTTVSTVVAVAVLSLTKSLSIVVRRKFRYLHTRVLSSLTIKCQIKPQKHATRSDLRYDSYSGLWYHKPMKELGFECDFVKLA